MAAITRDPAGGAALINYVGNVAGEDAAYADTAYLSAYGLVVGYLGSLVLDEAQDSPDEADVAAVRGAILEVGSKLWDRRNAPGGEVTIDLDGTPARLAPRDPMVTVYPVLDRVLDTHTGDDGLTLGGGFA